MPVAHHIIGSMHANNTRNAYTRTEMSGYRTVWGRERASVDVSLLALRAYTADCDVQYTPYASAMMNVRGQA